MSVLKQIFKEEDRLEEFMGWWDDADIEEGEYHKHDTRFATKYLAVTDVLIQYLPELAPFKGCVFEQEGTISYNYGWDSYDEIALYKQEQQETTEYHDFRSLLSHLNAEENDMAQEFADKYIKKTAVVKKLVTNIE